jgi:hypothetical protein
MATTAESAPALALALGVEDVVAGVELLELDELLELLLLPHAAIASAHSTDNGARRQLFHLSIKKTLSSTYCPVSVRAEYGTRPRHPE